ncbi:MULTISPECIES: HU family DNA-binding protein [unclassified Microcoleus]|uniref:HU family DNA-binding protein n=1 Tax=unclassified Microcoleus TaxID=2642155 RepID=UPI002FD30162
MNKKELIEAIAKKRGMTPEAVAYDLNLAYDEIFAAIIQAVAEGKVVEIPGFGRFHRTERSFCRTRAPFSRKIPSFSPDLAFKDAVSEGAKNK